MRESFSKVCALATVRNDGDLEMDDGSVWRVEPDDIPKVRTWRPGELISINLVDSHSRWPYQIFNVDTEVSVRGRNIAGGRKDRMSLGLMTATPFQVIHSEQNRLKTLWLGTTTKKSLLHSAKIGVYLLLRAYTKLLSFLVNLRDLHVR